MEYVKFGNTGMDVSRICLGTMGFGDPDKWIHKWVLNENESREIIKKALELGINFFDTANVYSLGESEKILGKALKNYAQRDEIVIATKVFNTMKKDRANSSGLSRKHIMNEIDNSLNRLETDFVDLYIIHRWDYNTPIEETMSALNDVVKSGKARYIGASAMFAWQFQKAQFIAEKNGWTKFVSMQNHYNLLYREEEREMIPLCKDQKIALTPYSPLAGGRLTRDLTETTLRGDTDEIAKMKYDNSLEHDKIVIERVKEIAGKYNVQRAEVALSWLLKKDQVVSPIVGATKFSHLETAVSALNLKLTEEDINYLEETYVPHRVVGAI